MWWLRAFLPSWSFFPQASTPLRILLWEEASKTWLECPAPQPTHRLRGLFLNTTCFRSLLQMSVLDQFAEEVLACGGDRTSLLKSLPYLRLKKFVLGDLKYFRIEHLNLETERWEEWFLHVDDQP